MRILMTTTNSSLMDGINRHILTISHALNNVQGVEVAVCTTFVPGDLNQQLESCGVKTFSLWAKHGHQFKVFINFLKVLREYKPDLVHIHVLPFWAQVLLKLFFKKLVLVQTIHGIADEDVPIKQRIRQKIIQSIFNLFTVKIWHKIFISDGVLNYCKLNDKREVDGRAKYSVIYNPIDLNLKDVHRGGLRSRLGVSHEVPIIGTVCRIAMVKKPMVFIRVFGEVLAKNEHAHAVVIGDGDPTLVAEMKAYVAQMGLENRIHFLGHCLNACELIADFNCFVMTSDREGMPTALLEAMALGVPIAFMRGEGGLKDLERLNDTETSFAIVNDAGDVHAMAKGILKLLSDSVTQARMVANSYRLLDKYFSIEVVRSQLITIYNQEVKR